jgi:hypothetical protein
MPAPPAEYTPAQRIIAAATRLREAWRIPNLDIAEMHEAVMSLILTTGTKDLASALGVLHDVESGYGHRSE